MNRKLLVGLLVALSLIGIADSWYLSEHVATDTPLVCDIGGGLDGCNQVAQSPYSQIAGVPLAYIGLAFYGVFFLISLAALLLPPHKTHHIAMTVLSATASVASVAFLYIQLVLIGAVCVYCVISALLTFFSLPIAILLLCKHSDPVLQVS